MATMNITINSTRPLMMQAETLANPLSAVTKAHKAVAGKRKKSEDDYLWLLESEWRASMYHDAKIGPYLPGLNIEACLFEGAKAFKLGKLSKQALSVMDDRVPLEYEGPRDIKGMYGDGGSALVDVRGVNVGGRKVMRARPLFLRWGCSMWLDVNRVKVTSEKPVMERPKFEWSPENVAKGEKGPAEKPSCFKP